ncbi:AAA family ATPase [Crossiella sp. SN42]|nr:AAA family ATPase [Crossiella sp. SN42]MCO1575569.1 AAA family ATPase [Crossiella sp. SN42]
MAAIAQDWLDGRRVVSLVGVSGVGKTRLAVAAARHAVKADDHARETGRTLLFPDGVWLVRLVEARDLETLVAAVARALSLADLGPSQHQRLLELLQESQLLLVLDNCEHVRAEVAELLNDLLRQAPGVRVLATSVRWLGIAGDTPRVVRPLSVPTVDDTSGELSEAMQLLWDRACAEGYDLASASPAERAAAAEVCRLLSGVPLAIELSSLYLADATVQETLSFLRRELTARRFSVLTADDRQDLPDRQKDMEHVLALHYDSCSAPEQKLWERMSVWSDGCERNDAAAVCSDLDDDGQPTGHIDGEPVRWLLNRLVRKSVLLADRNSKRGQVRYRQLEILRLYGHSMLERRGEVLELRRRHAHHFHALARTAALGWPSGGELGYLTGARANVDNYYSALSFCATTPGEEITGVEICLFLAELRFPWYGGELRAMWRRVQIASAALERAGVAGVDRVRVLELLHSAAAAEGWMALCMGEQDLARACLDRCIRLAETQPALAKLPDRAFLEGAFAFLVTGDQRRAVSQLKLARRGHAQHPERRGSWHNALLILAITCAFGDDVQLARTVIHHCLEEAKHLRAPWAISWAEWALAVSLLRHDGSDSALQQADQIVDRILPDQHEMEDQWGYGWSWSAKVWISARRKQYHQAAFFAGWARQMQHRLGVVLRGIEPYSAETVRAENDARKHLGGRRFEALNDRGARSSDEESLRLLRFPNAAEFSEVAASTVLTPAEEQVAAMVALGYGNKRIAEERHTSLRTVETQISSAISKLAIKEDNPRRHRDALIAWAKENLEVRIAEISHAEQGRNRAGFAGDPTANS